MLIGFLKISLVSSLLLIAGCSGGGGASNTVPAPVQQQDPVGIWTGVIHSNSLNQDLSATCLVSKNMNLFYRASNNGVMSAIISISGNSGIATGNLSLNGQVSQVTMNISKVITKSLVQGTYSGGGDSGNFSFNYNAPISDNAPSWATIAGVYTARQSTTGLDRYVQLKNDGTFNQIDSQWMSTEMLVRSGKYTSDTTPGILNAEITLANSGNGTGKVITGYGYYSNGVFTMFLNNNGLLWHGWLTKIDQ